MDKDIFTRLQEGLSTFSRGRQSISRYILENREEAAFLTAAKIAKATGVSESTVTRFALELGYSGFPAMQEDLQGRVLEKLRAGESGDDAAPLDRALYIAGEGLRRLGENIRPGALLEAASAVRDAGRVYFLCDRKMHPLTQGFYEKLRLRRGRVCPPCVAVGQELPGEMLDLEPGDALVLLCAREPEPFGDAALLAGKKLGASTLCFSLAPGLDADHTFFVTESAEDMLPVALMVLLNGFLTALDSLLAESSGDWRE